MALWTPANAPSGALAAWYDPSESGSLSVSGGLISQANDKSGNGRHATAAGALRVPIGTIGSLGSFAPTGSQYLAATIAAASTTNVSSLFVVWDPNNGLPFEVPFCIGVSGGVFPNAEMVVALTNANFLVSGDDARGNSLYYGSPDLGLQIAGCVQSLTSATLYQTGNLVATDASTISARSSANVLGIGCYSDATLRCNSPIGEIILTVGAISAALRQQFEGYLAWKWDGGTAGTLVGKLPSGHPYKSAAPISEQTLAPSVLSNSSTISGPMIARGLVALAAPVSTNTSTLYGPTVSQGGAAQSLSFPLLTNSGSLYAATVMPGAVTLSPGALANSNTFLAATAAPRPVALFPGALTNGGVLYPSVVALGALTLAPSRLANVGAVYGALVTPGAVVLGAGRFENGSAPHQPAVIQPGGLQSLFAPILANPSAFYQPSVVQAQLPGTYPLAIVGGSTMVRHRLAGGGAVAAGAFPSTGRVIVTKLRGRP